MNGNGQSGKEADEICSNGEDKSGCISESGHGPENCEEVFENGQIAGIKNEIIDNSASYIQSWLNVLKDRKNGKLIVIAAGQAQKAVDYITKDSYEPDLIHF